MAANEPIKPNNSNESPIGKESTGPKQSKRVETETKRKSLKEHKNPIVRGAARVGFWVWIAVMAVGLGFAFLISFALL